MVPTRFLFNLADYEGVKVVWNDFDNVDGIYICADDIDYPVIGLSNQLRTNERKLRCVFAHELGHHFLTAGHHMVAASRTSGVYAAKNEVKATSWAVKLLIPTDMFLDCIRRGMTCHELCNYFFVLQEYITHKAELLHKDTSLTNALAELKASYNVVF